MLPFWLTNLHTVIVTAGSGYEFRLKHVGPFKFSDALRSIYVHEQLRKREFYRMKIVSTFHQPSSVTSSLKCTLSAQSGLSHLVVAKSNRIEVYAITAEGLKHECNLEIWGRALSIKAVSAKDKGVSNLLVLLDHPHPKLILLEFQDSASPPALVEIWHAGLHDRHARAAEFFTEVVVAATGDLAVASCYTGKLKVVCFKHGRVSKEFDAILPELNLLALSFIETTSQTHTLAILHIDHLQRLQLLARDLDTDEVELSVAPSSHLQRAVFPTNLFPSADNPPMLVPIPPFSLGSTEENDAECLGGVLILGGRKVMFVEVASVEEQKYEKGKEKRQQRRKSRGVDSMMRVAKQKEKEREAKKVKARATVKWPWSEVAAWCPADNDMRRFFIGDTYGRLALLTITDSPGLIMVPLGEISAPTTLSYLSSQMLYVGSHTGDSQLLRIHPTPQGGLSDDTLPIPCNISTTTPASLTEDPPSPSPRDDEDVDMSAADEGNSAKRGKIVRLKGTFIEVVEQFTNIAPIADAVMADTDESGQPQIVTCSGEGNTGSLKLIRTGADFQELAVMKDVPNVTGIFGIRARYEEEFDAYVLLSTLYESYLFGIEGRETMTYVDPKSTALITDTPTLSLANIPRRTVRPGSAGAPAVSSYADSALVVQATSRGVTLVEYDPTLATFSRVGGWTPDQGSSRQVREVVAASMNASQFVVALSGGTLVVLNLGLDGQLSVVKTKEFHDKEIAAISCAPLDPLGVFASYIAVAFWGTNDIGILSLKDEQTYLDTICSSSPLPSLPRSVVFHNFGKGNKSKDPDYHPIVVVGLADGTVACMSWQENQLRDLKFFPLGQMPVSLTASEVDGRRAVLASGSRAAVFYWEKQRLCQSSVMLKDVTVGASLHTSHFPSCQILATHASLYIGHIRGADKMQIRSVPFGLDVPRRIGYHAACNMFGVACTRSTPSRIGETTVRKSSLNLLDGATFDRLARFECETSEEISSVKSLSESSLTTSAAFCVGTFYDKPGEYEPSAGRLLLFDVVGTDELKLVASEETEGCVYAIATMNSMIIAAINTSVDVYCVVADDGPVRMRRVGRWNHNYFVTSLVAHDDRVIVGDAVSSVSVLSLQNRDLRTVARDYAPLWPITVEATRKNGVIGSNADCNIFTFTVQTVEDRQRLERDGHYHFGEVIVKFLSGGLSVQDTHEAQVFEPEHIFFTSSGRIGVILHVNDDVALDLTHLQSNMASEIVGPGDVHHSKWRTPSNARGGSDAEHSIGFLDGDFLEQFLAHPAPDKLLKGKQRAERVKISKEKVDIILEKLQSLH